MTRFHVSAIFHVVNHLKVVRVIDVDSVWVDSDDWAWSGVSECGVNFLSSELYRKPCEAL